MNNNSMGGKRTPKLAQVDTSFDRAETPQSKGRFPLYIAINEYIKRMEDELDMRPGDKIQVITDDEEYSDGWFYGRNLRTDEEGLYPKVFTQEISSPSLMRAKSAKRVASPLANGSTTNLSTFSNDGSMSELPTPQPLETAAPINLANANNPVVDRKISVKTTMSDIDKALEEFRGESLADISHQTTNDTAANTTNTTEIDMSNPQVHGSMSAHSLTEDTSFGISSINGIETKELQPTNAINWLPEQVTAYFIASGFDVESSSRFQQHKISGAILLELELAHLKELDINSFGTRFEIFKEIEAIKEIVNTKKSARRTSQLMPAAAVNQRSFLGHSRKTSQSLDELPSRSTPPSQNEDQKPIRYRPLSLALGKQGTSSDSTTEAKESGLADSIFLSPRKAPKPPSYPSPVQPPRSPVARSFTPSPSTSNFAQGYKHPPPTIYERATQQDKSSISSDELKTPNYQFPRTTPPQPSSATPVKVLNSKYVDEDEDYMAKPDYTVGNRGSVIYSGQQVHRKTKSGGSFVDLFNRISMLSPHAQNGEFNDSEPSPGTDNQVQRPSSSVYEHSRTASPHHIKHPSNFSNTDVKKHRRNSSILSFLSNKPDETVRAPSPSKRTHSRSASRSHNRNMSLTNASSVRPFVPENKSGSPTKRQSMLISPTVASPSVLPGSPDKKGKRRSVSAKEPTMTTTATDSDIFFDAKEDILEDKKNKRSVSDAMKSKNLRSKSSKNVARKQKTSAFVEGIRTVSVNEAMKEADCSGWMSKKGSGAMGVWRNRFFTLHGTRLSYFANTTDTRERGLIDITAHRVLPAKDDDKFVALYAASTGKGRYCFKLLPPQPGSKKGLTFTQPRVHYFAVETKEEMRAWMAALIKATIDIDTTVPIISSCSTPTVSLTKAQEMLLQAREESRLREEQRYLNEEDEDQMLWEQQQRAEQDSQEGVTNGSTPNSSMQQNTTLGSGFQSPYLLASGVLSPGPTKNNGRFTDQASPDYFGLDPKYVGNKI